MIEVKLNEETNSVTIAEYVKIEGQIKRFFVVVKNSELKDLVVELIETIKKIEKID